MGASAVCGVYAIICTPTGDVYVGSSADVRQRLSMHRSQLRAGSHPNRRLQAAWTAWGAISFEMVVLEECATPTDAVAAERRWLGSYVASRGVEGVFNVAEPLENGWHGTGLASREGGAEEAFLDAAERLLVAIGYAKITTRRLGEEAGANHGLIHYYFSSMEQLFVRVLERYTERLIARQRAMYAGPEPFIEKWRTAMTYLDEDRESGYQKVWYELQALAWNKPELRERVANVRRKWADVLTEAFTQAAGEYGIDTERFPGRALAVLAGTFNEGIMLERLSGIYDGHAELLAMIDGWLESLEAAKARREASDESAAS